jgi:hypothetical protein
LAYIAVKNNLPVQKFEQAGYFAGIFGKRAFYRSKVPDSVGDKKIKALLMP